MDPLSDALSLLKIRNLTCGGLNVAGDLCIEFPARSGILCYSIVKGEVWLAVEGLRKPVLVRAGDCLLLPTGAPFKIGNDLNLPGLNPDDIFGDGANGSIITINGGGDVLVLAVHFTFAGLHSDHLTETLPALVHIRDESGKAALRWALERMMLELKESLPGDSLLIEHLAHIILIQALRLHLSKGDAKSGWLYALGDKQIYAALKAIHGRPGERWTVEKLAACADMSRSAFALKFKQKVGVAPLEYLTRWRILSAADRLINSDDSISIIAPSLGYDSDSAFCVAFKKIMKCSPRQYAKQGDDLFSLHNKQS